MRKLTKVFREETTKETVYEKLVQQLNKDKAENVIILNQEYTKILVMYKTDNIDNAEPLSSCVFIDEKKQDELLEESISDDVAIAMAERDVMVLDFIK